MNFQKYTDKLLALTLLPLIPRTISPNQVTIVRIISIPFIYYLLTTSNYSWGLILFSIAALTDALDGAMARVRDQVTETGKVLDGAADKGLILLLAIIYIPKYFGLPLLLSILILEAFSVVLAYRSKLKLKYNPGANWAGKIKMIIQTAAFIALIVGMLNNHPGWLKAAENLLYISLPFILAQALLYPTKNHSS